MRKVIEVAAEVRSNMESRLSLARAEVSALISAERAATLSAVADEHEAFRAALKEKYGSPQSLEELAAEVACEEQTSLAIKVMEARSKSSTLARENEHLRKEIKRAADKIVRLTREKEEGAVEDVKFLG
mmetsp:Transcript_737/g.1564  ORF Transcript_737/g.1564 Transcript_737/m.1564 type:complete len:129 (-) Transcript_737:124-510(-)